MYTVSHSENLHKFQIKDKTLGFPGFTGLMAEILYFILFVFYVENNDSRTALHISL